VDVISRALSPPLSPPTNTGVGFLVGLTPAGQTPAPPNVALVRSLTEYEATFGARGSVAGDQATYDSADAFFREGGSQLYVSRTNPGTVLDVEAASASLEPLKAGKAKISGGSVDTLALDPTIKAALDALGKDLGPGQVWIADHTLAGDAANQSALLAHAAATNRVALLTTADGTAAALEAAAAALATDANARFGALFAPSAIIPGVTAGTTRTVPYAAVEAGIIARNDATFTANQPAAGDLGQCVFVIDVEATYTDAEYTALNDASVNMARVKYGGVRTYGYRTLDAQNANSQWVWFGNSRLNMEITAQAEAIGEHYVFTTLDGQGKTIAQFGGDLSAMLNAFFLAGALYGATPQDAFRVDVGSSVNTPTTIANGELHAVLLVKMSPSPEWVVIEIVKVATTQTIAPAGLSVAA